MGIDTSDFDNDRKIWEKTAWQIGRDCQPFLSQIHNPFSLYRGMREMSTVLKKAVRLDDRRPQEMDPLDHDYLNQYFTQEYGAPFRNAIFVSGDFNSAGYFGRVYSIFPIGEFKFLWSPRIDDLNFAHHDLLDGLFADRTIPPTKVQRAQGLIKALRNVDYRTTDLKAAADSGNEIMIRCKEYYALPLEAIDGTGMVTPLWDIMDQAP